MPFAIFGPRHPDFGQPFWKALPIDSPWEAAPGSSLADLHHRRRDVFLDMDGQRLPGTFLARCKLQRGSKRAELRVRIRGIYEEFEPLEHEVTVLLEARPSRRGIQVPVCVAGEIPIKLDGAYWTRHFPCLTDISSVSLTSSGLAIEGSVRFPWMEKDVLGVRLNVSYAPNLPRGNVETWVVQVDRDHLARDHNNGGDLASRLSGAFERFGQMVEGPRCLRTTLAANATTTFHWQVRPAPRNQSAEYALVLPPGAIEMRLSDGRNGPSATLDSGGAKITVISTDKRGNPTSFDLNVTAGVPGPCADAPRLDYTFSRDAAANDSESLSWSGLVTDYDPYDAARVLRDCVGLSRPEADAVRSPSATADSPQSFTPFLWGTVPIREGWIQIPFFNITEELERSVRQGQSPDREDVADGSSLLNGAAEFGNALPDSSSDVRNEVRWSATILNAVGFDGRWRFTRTGENAWNKQSLKVRFCEVQAVLKGFLWLATKKLSYADGLPDLDEWPVALHDVTLRTCLPGHTSSSPYTVRFDDLEIVLENSGGATLGKWCVKYSPNRERMMELTGRGSPFSGATALKALSWQRHPTLPTIHALPLTQLQRPPSHPSANRQLAPFEFRGEGTARLGGNGAASWPSPIEGSVCAVVDHASRDLLMAYLSVPGLAAPLSSPFESLDYYFGLPYLDELHALSVINDEVGDDQGLPRWLQPARLAKYWRGLDERGFLAAADADAALYSRNGQDREEDPPSPLHEFWGLVEPFPWGAEFRGPGHDALYPGTLTLSDTNQPSNVIRLSGNEALLGIRGHFSLKGGYLRLTNGAGASPGEEFDVVGGALQEAEAQGRRRDQRGLIVTNIETVGRVTKTDIHFQKERAEEPSQFTLYTLSRPLGLSLGSIGESWSIWLRDVPARRSSSSGKAEFCRADSASGAMGVNNPDAMGRHHNFRNGYEWRLGGACTRFGPFEFYPLTLEHVSFSADEVARVVLTGRLQLPVNASGEQSGQRNTVRMTFLAPPGGDLLEIENLEFEESGGHIVWPLSALPGGPQLVVGGIGLQSGRVCLSSIRIEYFLFGEKCVCRFPDTVEWDVDLSELVLSHQYPETQEAVTVASVRCKLRFDPPYEHEAICEIRALWKGGDGLKVEARSEWDLLNTAAIPITTSAALFVGVGSAPKRYELALPVRSQGHWPETDGHRFNPDEHETAFDHPSFLDTRDWRHKILCLRKDRNASQFLVTSSGADVGDSSFHVSGNVASPSVIWRVTAVDGQNWKDVAFAEGEWSSAVKADYSLETNQTTFTHAWCTRRWTGALLLVGKQLDGNFVTSKTLPIADSDPPSRRFSVWGRVAIDSGWTHWLVVAPGDLPREIARGDWPNDVQCVRNNEATRFTSDAFPVSGRWKSGILIVDDGESIRSARIRSAGPTAGSFEVEGVLPSPSTLWEIHAPDAEVQSAGSWPASAKSRYDVDSDSTWFGSPEFDCSDSWEGALLIVGGTPLGVINGKSKSTDEFSVRGKVSPPDPGMQWAVSGVDHQLLKEGCWPQSDGHNYDIQTNETSFRHSAFFPTAAWIGESTVFGSGSTAPVESVDVERSSFSVSGCVASPRADETWEIRARTDNQLKQSTFQLRWTGIEGGDQGLELLPGLRTMEYAPGYAVSSFSVRSTGSAPAFDLDAGFMECLFHSSWGESLQESQQQTPSEKAVFGSAAGTIDAALVARWDRSGSVGAWATDLLLNGVIEVKNLISWPLEAAVRHDDRLVFEFPTTDANSPLSHYRHTARVLLNQVSIPGDKLRAGTVDGTVFALGPLDADSIQFLAVVEHQLIKVQLGTLAADSNENPPLLGLKDDRRWTLVQEVRLASPAGFREFLHKHRRVHRHGYFSSPLAQQMHGEVLPCLPDNTVIVELSTATYFKKQVLAASHSFSPIQYLPRGIQRAIPAALSDYDGVDALWELSVVPFVGRLQPERADNLDGGRVPPLRLREDPILHLHRIRNDPDDSVVNNFTSRSHKSQRTVRLGLFDGIGMQTWRHLDPATMAEQWHRISSPPSRGSRDGANTPANQLPAAGSVLAALPMDGPGRVSQPSCLASLFNSDRTAIPPSGGTTADHGEIGPVRGLEWRQGALLVDSTWSRETTKWPERTSHDRQPANYAFHTACARLQYALPPATTGTAASRVPAATVVPPPMRSKWQTLAHPVSYIVSPYLGVGYTPGSQEDDGGSRVAVFADVLAVANFRGAMASIARNIFQSVVDPETGIARVPANDEIERWALRSWSNVAGDSNIGVLRLREVYRDDETGVTFRFVFVLLTGPVAKAPKRSELPLRAAPDELRFAEPGYSRLEPPQESRSSFEQASPRVRSVLPHQKHEPSGTPERRQYSGYSGLQIDVDVTNNGEGFVGSPWTPPARGRLEGDSTEPSWWLAFPHHVQFAPACRIDDLDPEPDRCTDNRALLPRKYRSRAIRSLPPILPDVPLPDSATIRSVLARHVATDEKAAGDGRKEKSKISAALDCWQPILPGSLRWSLVGARPGAFFAIRPHIQITGPTAGISGSIPVQHRYPRPIPISQTIGSPLDDKGSVAVFARPAGLAYVEAHEGPAGQGAGVQVELVARDTKRERELAKRNVVGSSYGDFPGGIWLEAWKGSDCPVHLRFSLRSRTGDEDNWQASVVLLVGSRRIRYGTDDKDSTSAGFLPFEPPTCKLQFDDSGNVDLVFKPVPAEADANAFSEWLGRLRHGDCIEFEVAVFPPARRVSGAQLNVRLETRAISRTAPPLPFCPVYTQFEDPAFNARLATPVNRKTVLVERPGEDESGLLTLAVDRRQCNATTQLSLVFELLSPQNENKWWRDLREKDVQVRIWVVRSGVSILIATSHLPDRQLLTVALPGYADTLNPGERVMIGLVIPGTSHADGRPLLQVEVVADPVAPDADAAYGMLRANGTSVECVRFAWRPRPSRVELACPDDLLLRPLVRRRAVYSWLDVVRVGTEPRYAIQKIDTFGATDVPEAKYFVPTPRRNE